MSEDFLSVEAVMQIERSKEKCKRNRDNWKARALKAEAMCEWLAERLEESDDTVLAADTWLVAAREAVIHTANS